jgi:ABC-type sugar transport system substrate-binding protein
MKKRIYATLMALVIATATAQAAEKATHSGPLEIAVLMPNAGDPYFQSKAYGYVEEAKALGVNLKLYNAGGYDHLPDQIRQLEDLTVKKVDGIIFTPVDPVATVPTLEATIDAGVKVVDDDILIHDSTKIPVRISEDSFEVGKQQGELIVAALSGKGNVVMLKGPSGVDLFMKREEGAKSVFKQYPDIKIVAEEYHQSDVVTANRLMEDFLQAHPDGIDAVYTMGTQTALGAVTAIQAAGIKAGRIKVATIDWSPEIEAMIGQEWVYGSVVCEPVKLARTSVESVVKLVKGEKVDPTIHTASQKVTAANVHTFDRSGIFTPTGWDPTSLYQ